MMLEHFQAFDGQHCETTATGTLLRQTGITLSEPMLFGLGQGLGFIYWDSKNMDFPFLGGRIKPEQITHNLAGHLKLGLVVKETASLKTAWSNVIEPLSQGLAVGLKLDCFYLDYFSTKVHFAAHYAALGGWDNDYAYLADTRQQGGLVKTSLASLALARSAKGPMASRNLSYTLQPEKKLPLLKHIIPRAIRQNAEDYLNPPIKNIGYRGIAKAAAAMIKWLDRPGDAKPQLRRTAALMERGGTGGALFRNLYRDFLKESLMHISSPLLQDAHAVFCVIAKAWTEAAGWIGRAGETGDKACLVQAADRLKILSEQEEDVMTLLRRIA
jgi:hypothetical protein